MTWHFFGEVSHLSPHTHTNNERAKIRRKPGGPQVAQTCLLGERNLNLKDRDLTGVFRQAQKRWGMSFGHRY
jgi:hypothetical protein